MVELVYLLKTNWKTLFTYYPKMVKEAVGKTVLLSNLPKKTAIKL